MRVWLAGLNHRTAPVAVREKLAFVDAEVPDALAGLRACPGVSEAMILSTCNRVELALAADDAVDGGALLADYLRHSRRVDAGWLDPHLYTYAGRDAIRHLFRVAASLDSMIVGEPQILGQLKAAYGHARECGTLGGVLDAAVSRAFNVAKRVRTETDIGSSAVSISYAAVELAREIFGNLKGRKVMLVGAGKMSELAARHLYRSGASILVTNRTEARALDLARVVHGSVVPYDAYRQHLKDIDIIMTSSAAPDYLLRKDEMRRILDARRNRPVFLIDMAVPRNIEPAVNELDNVFLYDIDDLQKVVNDNMLGRLQAAEEAARIVEEEVDRLDAAMRTRSVGPVIVDLQDALERLRKSEIERVRSKLGDLTPQQEQALDQLTRGLMAKVAHGPIAALRRNAGDEAVIDRIRSIFRLDEEVAPALLRRK